MKIILALLIFSLIVVFHELGHFLLAKKNGVLERNGHTEATVDLCRLAGLKECGVRIVQGFLFSRPIPVEEYEKKYAVARPVPEGLPPSGRCA